MTKNQRESAASFRFPPLDRRSTFLPATEERNAFGHGLFIGEDRRSFSNFDKSFGRLQENGSV
jgi:hypothetical protein